MTFTEDILGAATNIFEKTARKSVYYAQIAKLNVRIAAENNTLKEHYARLGEAYFNGIESGESDSAQFAKEACEKIVEIKAGIEAMKEEIEKLKAEDRAAATAEAEARAEKAAQQAEAADKKEPEDDEVEITIEVKEPKPAEAPQEPPIGTLYVDQSDSDSQGN